MSSWLQDWAAHFFAFSSSRLDNFVLLVILVYIKSTHILDHIKLSLKREKTEKLRKLLKMIELCWFIILDIWVWWGDLLILILNEFKRCKLKVLEMEISLPNSNELTIEPIKEWSLSYLSPKWIANPNTIVKKNSDESIQGIKYSLLAWKFKERQLLSGRRFKLYFLLPVKILI